MPRMSLPSASTQANVYHTQQVAFSPVISIIGGSEFINFLQQCPTTTYLAEVFGQDVGQLLSIFVLLFLRPRHDRQLHRTDLLSEDVTLCSRLVEVVEDCRSYDARYGRVGLQDLKDI